MNNNSEYLAFIEPSQRLQIRLVSLLTALAYFAYSFIDPIILTERSAALASIYHRYVMTFLLVMVAIFTLFETRLRWSIYLLMLAPVSTGVLNNYMILFAGENPIYLAEIYIGIMWLYAFSGLSTQHASVCVGGFFFIGFVMHWFKPLNADILYFHLFWSVFVIAFGLLISFLLQRQNRKIFHSHCELALAAYRDELTGAYNRKKLDELIVAEIQRCERFAHTFSFVLLDIDHFKQVNDKFGHAAGDKVLQEMVSLIKSTVRNTDILVRWGGEEFVLICPESNEADTCTMLSRLRAVIGAHHFSEVGTKTVSIGLTQFTQGDDLTALVRRADKALYQAKAGGRDQLVCG